MLQIVWDSVHSGSGRTALANNNTDYYPVPLSADTLRPGTLYADPYGHILMIVRRIAQTEDAAGIDATGRGFFFSRKRLSMDESQIRWRSTPGLKAIEHLLVRSVGN